MEPVRPVRLRQHNQGSVIISNEEARGLKTGDDFKLNGVNVTVLMVIQLDSKSSELVYHLLPCADDGQ